eukprot:678111-Pelagomonas_calceolata.AAC.1
MPVQPTLKTLALHYTYPLMELGITSLASLLNDSLTHVIDGNKLTSLLGCKVRTRHMIALHVRSHTLNSHNLTPDLINPLYRAKIALPINPHNHAASTTQCKQR